MTEGERFPWIPGVSRLRRRFVTRLVLSYCIFVLGGIHATWSGLAAVLLIYLISFSWPERMEPKP